MTDFSQKKELVMIQIQETSILSNDRNVSYSVQLLLFDKSNLNIKNLSKENFPNKQNDSIQMK